MAATCLGLAVAWGAVRLGIGLDEAGQRTAALIWILAVPICECLRRYAVIGLRIVSLDFGFAAGRRSLLGLDHSPAAICLFALIFGGIGIGLWRLAKVSSIENHRRAQLAHSRVGLAAPCKSSWKRSVR